MESSTAVVLGFLGLFGGAILWRVLRGSEADARFVVRVTGEGAEGVTIRGDIPGHDHVSVREFVAELGLPEGAKILGIPDGERFRLEFADIPDDLHQRLRNFFYATL